MEFKVVKSDPGFTQVALSGKLDLAGEQEIGDRFRSLIESRGTSFLVDMSQVSYMASLGIRLLFGCAKTLAGRGRKLVVVNPQPMVKETLLSSGTAKFIPVVKSTEEALSRYVTELSVVRTNPDLTHLALSGKLDVEGEEQIGDQFRALIESRSTSFLVDLSRVSYLASLGIRLLFAGAKSLGQRGKKLVVINPQPMVEETLLNSGTAKLIPIARDETAALQLL